VDGILETDPAIAVTGAVKPRQRPQPYVCVAASIGDDLGLKGVKNALKNRPNDRRKRRDFIGDWIALELKTKL
jgi:hypothetical protein